MTGATTGAGIIASGNTAAGPADGADAAGGAASTGLAATAGAVGPCGRITPFTMRPCTGWLADARNGAEAVPSRCIGRRRPQRQKRMRRRMPKQQQTLVMAHITPKNGGIR